MKVERLAGTDLSMLWPDDLDWPQDIGGLAIVEEHHLVDEHGALPIAGLRVHIEGKPCDLPRFRQVLHRPGFGCGPPYWADDVRFDIGRHVQVLDVSELSGPGSWIRVSCCDVGASTPPGRSGESGF